MNSVNEMAHPPMSQVEGKASRQDINYSDYRAESPIINAIISEYHDPEDANYEIYEYIIKETGNEIFAGKIHDRLERHQLAVLMAECRRDYNSIMREDRQRVGDIRDELGREIVNEIQVRRRAAKKDLSMGVEVALANWDIEAKELERLYDEVNEAKNLRFEQSALQAAQTADNFIDAPPCLEHLVRVGFSGHMNNALLSMAVYAKQKFPDSWQEKVKEYNQEFMGPGTPSEVSNIIKGLLKREYFYKCNDQPLAAHCDKNACHKRKFGIGNAVPDFAADMNQLFFVSMEGNKVFVFSERYDPELNRKDLTRLSFNTFREFHNHQNVVIGYRPDGTSILRPRGTAWLECEHRRQYEGVILAPDEHDLPANYYNLWKGFGVESAKGSWKLMRDHLLYVVCNGDETSFQYLMGWLATAVQKPNRPAEVAVVLRGNKGTGKGVIGNSMCKIFNRNALHISSGKHLVGNFNNHLRSCIFLFADESFWAGDKQHESVLKALITEPTLTIEAKGVDVIQARNMLHILMASNCDWVVPASKDERRYFVLDVSDKHAQDSLYFEPLFREIDGGGLSAMLYDLLQFDLTNFNIRKVPQTNALLEQQLHSFDPVTMWWFQKLNEGELIDEDKPEDDLSLPWNGAPKRRLFEEYLKVTGQAGSRHRGYQTAFGMTLKKLLPDGWPRDRKVTEDIWDVNKEEFKKVIVKYLMFPSLDLCRKHFSALMKTEIDWKDEKVKEDVDTSDPLDKPF